MATDHSLTYKKVSFKNVPHILRKNILEKEISKLPKNVDSYADFGCSNGFLTDIFRKILKPKKSYGFDYTDNIEKARTNHPEINFDYKNLNIDQTFEHQYNIVSCFETLEHVGNEFNALKTLKNASANKSIILISVPIEIGIIGIAKYLVKRFIFRYKLSLNSNDFEYFKALILNKNISVFRKNQDHYGSHFGYDYRNTDLHVDEIFSSRLIKKWNKGSSRFYKISTI